MTNFADYLITNENIMGNNDLIQIIEQYVEDNIHRFHESRISKLNTLKLDYLLKKKNPYLYRAKDLNTPESIVQSLAAAFMSSAEETMFGDWLEQLALFVSNYVYGGYKSGAEGIDLEMNKDGIHYFVSIKSGPNWSNSSSKAKLLKDFEKAQKIYRTGGNKNLSVPIEGCCYGKDNKPEKDSHTKLCGERFWSFISGSDSLYTDIIEPMGTNAHAHNEDYKKEYDRMITKFTKKFSEEYCDDNGNINWNKILKINSGKA